MGRGGGVAPADLSFSVSELARAPRPLPVSLWSDGAPVGRPSVCFASLFFAIARRMCPTVPFTFVYKVSLFWKHPPGGQLSSGATVQRDG